MAGTGGSSGRLLRATNKTGSSSSSSRRQPSSSTAADRNCNPARRIPSLKSPFPREARSSRISRRRAAEQRAALIALGRLQGAATSVDTPERKKPGVFFLSEQATDDLLLPLAYEIARRLILRRFGATWMALSKTCWSKVAETVIHRAVVSCQSFTLIGVAGSLLGSVPCFVKGCGLVLNSFLMRFRAMSGTVDQGEIMKLLIDALDMFLIGTALLKFAMGLYTMFYRSQSIQNPGHHISSSHSGTFNLKKLKEGARLRSITQAKTRIGHAVVLLLQAGVLEEFRSVPLTTGLDMACFAGAVLASSAGVFLLSKLTLTARDHRQRKNFTDQKIASKHAQKQCVTLASTTREGFGCSEHSVNQSCSP